MAYYSADEMKRTLSEYPQYREKLYCRGFLLTNASVSDLSDYPFYGNWSRMLLTNGYSLYFHKDTTVYTYENEGVMFFLIGHAYDPFHMKWDEYEMLRDLAETKKLGKEAFWDFESNLTGVFCLGYIEGENIIYTTDCCGMQLVYHGVVSHAFYLTSHSKLVSDLCDLQQDSYVTKLVNSRFYHYWGTWLPGDLSPYKELKRMQPNCAGTYIKSTNRIAISRYYPLHKIEETNTETEYRQTIHELGDIMSATMECIARKWTDKKVALSVTGGRDSMTALSCANGLYDKFYYFSYISNQPEAVDAYAAQRICKYLGIPHIIYKIPREENNYPGFEAFNKIMECNAGCIGANNRNDVRKRMYFSKHCDFDIEIKSWVNEMGRGWYYNKYNKKTFPNRPNAKYWRAMHKVYLSPTLIHATDRVFQDYLDKYYSEETFENISWLELYFWEFAWSGGEGVFLTSEHRISYEITIPFNNRKYIEKMLTVPLEKRICDSIPKDLIMERNPRIAECGIVIKDVEHTDMRARLVRAYLEIFSRIKF